MPKKSTVTCLIEYHDYLSSTLNQKSQVDSLYTDFSKAFDKVSHDLLIKKLLSLNLPANLIALIDNYLTNRKQCIVLRGCKSDLTDVTSGVPQGSLLGPLLFNLYVADLPSIFRHSKCIMYADDMKLFMRINTPEDSENFQMDIDRMYNWCTEWKMSLNIQKCAVITFTLKTNYPEFIYHINDTELRRVNNIKDLGIIFDTNLSFDFHIDMIRARTFKLLGFIQRQCKQFSNETITLLYKTLVRPVHDYGSSVWSPHYKTKIDSLEQIQKRLFKHICNRNRVTFHRFNYDNLCSQYNLPSLQKRRENIDIILFKKIISGYRRGNAEIK